MEMGTDTARYPTKLNTDVPMSQCTVRSRKRTRDPKDYEGLLREDISKAKKAKESSGIKRAPNVSLNETHGRPKIPRLLGPILGARFGALGPRISNRL